MNNKELPKKKPSGTSGLSDSTAPLGTSIVDQYGSVMLHIDGNNHSQLILTITNLTDDLITVSQLGGPVSATNCNFTFTLPNNSFYFNSPPEIDKANTSPGNWKLLTNSNDGWISNIYLANMGTCQLQPNGEEGDALIITLKYAGAVPDGSQLTNTQAIIQYQNVTEAGVLIQGETPPQTLGLMADPGKPMPLLGSFIGSGTVLNDDSPGQSLTLSLINTSEEALLFIPPPSGMSTQSYLEISFPVSKSDDDTVQSLCNLSEWQAVEAKLDPESALAWKIVSNIALPGVLTLIPDFNILQGIPSKGTVNLSLLGLTTSLPPGLVLVIISMKRFVKYGTQSLGVTIEKSPLKYNSALGGGMVLSGGTLGANNALQVTGDGSEALINIEQTGSGPALAVTSGNVLISDDVVISKSLAVNGINSSAGAIISSNSPINVGPDDTIYPLLVTPGGSGSGLAVGWNKQTGQKGETDFYNFGQDGVGGFSFYNNSYCGPTYPGNPDLLLSIDNTGANVKGGLVANSLTANSAAIAADLQVGGTIIAKGPVVSGNDSAFLSPGNNDGTTDVVFRKDKNWAYICPWGTGTANNQVSIGSGAKATDLTISGNAICQNSLVIGSWTISVDANNNLCFTNSQNVGQMIVNGQQAIVNGSPCHITNDMGTLNGTTKWDGPGDGSNGMAYWMDSPPDGESNLNIYYGYPASDDNS